MNFSSLIYFILRSSPIGYLLIYLSLHDIFFVERDVGYIFSKNQKRMMDICEGGGGGGGGGLVEPPINNLMVHPFPT